MNELHHGTRGFNGDVNAFANLRSLNDASHAHDVTGQEMPSELVAHFERAFDVDRIAFAQAAKVCAMEGLLNHVESHAPVVHVGGRQAHAVDGDAGSALQTRGVGQLNGVGPDGIVFFYRTDGTKSLNNAGEHDYASFFSARSRMRAMIFRVPSRSSLRPSTRTTSMDP